ncbi:MAG: DinB family protein [Planctomycetota bacterium]|nr:DinB family protein [Planctomycetota bacterium]
MNDRSSVRPVGGTLAAARATLDQCARFLDGLRPDAYATPSEVIKGSTIGQHVRHTLDHFAAALTAPVGGVIDYDHRERDTPVERAAGAALSLVADLTGRLLDLDEHHLDRPVRVRLMLSGEGDAAEHTSTLGRELAFAMHHAMHHHAMIAAIAREKGVNPPSDFGKAPSTIHHERATLTIRG